MTQVRPSVTFMISEPCPCCHATGRVEALETSFSKIEHEICRRLVSNNLLSFASEFDFSIKMAGFTFGYLDCIDFRGSGIFKKKKTSDPIKVLFLKDGFVFVLLY